MPTSESKPWAVGIFYMIIAIFFFFIPWAMGMAHVMAYFYERIDISWTEPETAIIEGLKDAK